VGRGRLAELPAILDAVGSLLKSPADLEGQVVLVTAGPTREPLDPVRYLSNRSSGKMGYALAEAAARRGAKSILVTGPTALAPPAGVDVVHVETAQEMHDAVLAKLEVAGVVIKAAAVADYRPARVAEQKLKKSGGVPRIVLEETPDILQAVGARKGRRILVGFAAETEDVQANARQKLAAKHLDLVVANEVGRPDTGFDADTNRVTLLDADGNTEELPLLSKREVADRILDRVAKLLGGSARTAKTPRAPSK
jgi:phosphopantothenoylcysteine decarboxylase/phosphopantothenate--cysteine ligase